MRGAGVLLLLLCACEEPKRAPVSQDGVTKIAPPTTAQIAAAIPKPKEDRLEDRLQRGAITDDDARLLGVLADKNKTITYAHLKKNADKYKGEPWRFRGKILEISETNGASVARIALDSYGNNAIYVLAPFETDFVEDNRVEVLGVLTGSFSYTSQAGWNITIPSIIAARMTKPAAPKRIVLQGLQQED